MFRVKMKEKKAKKKNKGCDKKAEVRREKMASPTPKGVNISP